MKNTFYPIDRVTDLIHEIRVLARLFVAGAVPPFIQSAPPIKLYNSTCITISLWLNTNLYTYVNTLFTLSYIVLNTS